MKMTKIWEEWDVIKAQNRVPNPDVDGSRETSWKKRSLRRDLEGSKGLPAERIPWFWNIWADREHGEQFQDAKYSCTKTEQQELIDTMMRVQWFLWMQSQILSFDY